MFAGKRKSDGGFTRVPPWPERESSRFYPETAVYVGVGDIRLLCRGETEMISGPGSGGTVPYGINYGHLPLIRDFMNEGSLLITSYVSY